MRKKGKDLTKLDKGKSTGLLPILTPLKVQQKNVTNIVYGSD